MKSMAVHSLTAPTAIAVAISLISLSGEPAQAQFDIKSPFFEDSCPDDDPEGENKSKSEGIGMELEAIGAVQFGLDDGEEEQIRQGHEFSVAFEPAEILAIPEQVWEPEFAVGLEQPRGDSLEASTIAFENTFRVPLWEEKCAPKGNGASAQDTGAPKERGSNGLEFGLGAFAAVEAALKDDEPDALEFGPILGLRHEMAEPYAIEVIANPFFERQIGEDRAPGIALSYGWQTTLELPAPNALEEVKIGFEAFGEIEDIGDAPPVSEQEHRIGPVVVFGLKPSGLPNLEFEVGMLFGLTDATADYALKWNIGIELE